MFAINISRTVWAKYSIAHPAASGIFTKNIARFRPSQDAKMPENKDPIAWNISNMLPANHWTHLRDKHLKIIWIERNLFCKYIPSHETWSSVMRKNSSALLIGSLPSSAGIAMAVYRCASPKSNRRKFFKAVASACDAIRRNRLPFAAKSSLSRPLFAHLQIIQRINTFRYRIKIRFDGSLHLSFQYFVE